MNIDFSFIGTVELQARRAYGKELASCNYKKLCETLRALLTNLSSFAAVVSLYISYYNHCSFSLIKML